VRAVGSARRARHSSAKAAGGVGDAYVFGGMGRQAFGADGGADHRDLRGHHFVDFQAGPAADAEGDAAHRTVPQVRRCRGGAGF
jgi:hypothetical protein